MKTAYYRIQNKPGQIQTVHADMISDKERQLMHNGFINLFCPACAERVFFSQASTDKRPGEKGYRTAHFKHQMKQNCAVEDCDLRVDGSNSSTYISQRLRTPLFLRPSNNGFILSAGFSTADKDAMHRLQTQHFKKLVIRKNNTLFAEAMLTDTSPDGNILYANLPDITNRNANITMSVVTDQGLAVPVSQANRDWSDVMDWFTERRDAMFQYSAGNAGEKLPSGSYIEAHRPYLIVDKNTTTGNSFFLQSKLKQLATKYGFTYEHKGSLNFAHHNHYDVHLLVLPTSQEVKDANDYEALFEYIREHFAVILCDTVAETRPLWPPASRKSDAFAVQPTTNNRAFILASGVDTSANICLHKCYDDKPARFAPLLDCNGLTVGSIQLCTVRTHISIEDRVSGNVSSYRLENFKQPPVHGISVNHEFLLDKPGTSEIALPDNKKLTLSASCPFTVYHNGNKLYVPTGAVQTIDVKHGDDILMLTDTNWCFELKIKPKTKPSMDTANRNRYERFKTPSKYKRF